MMNAVALDAFVKSYDEVRVSAVLRPVAGDDKVLVRITHAGVNYVDLLYCRGKHQNNRSLVRPPFTLGLEFSGIVVSAPTTSAFVPGDPVFGGGVGAYAEYIAVEPSVLRKVPTDWSLEDAAGIAATAPVSFGALIRAGKLKASDTVLIHAAAGGLGVMAVQIAKAVGATVIGTVGSSEKARVAKDLGADYVINYNVQDWGTKVLDITRGRGVDLTFDSVGLIEKSIHCSKYGARIIIIGFAGREGNLERIAANRILLKSITLRGYRFGEDGRQNPQETETIWHGLGDLFGSKSIKAVVYEKMYRGLETVPEAMKDMAARKVWGKAIIRVQATGQTSHL